MQNKTTYSRRLTVEERENKRKATGFFLLTLAVIAFMIFFGFSLLAKVSGFFYDLKKTDQVIEGNDNTPPPPPRFSDIPSFTNKDELEIRGFTEAGATVAARFNNDTIDLLANNSGEFSHSFTLEEGENYFSATSKDSSGNQSSESQTYTIVQDKNSPETKISKPADGEVFYGSRQKQITVEGTTEKDAQVLINERLAITNGDGIFSVIVGLNDGENKISIKTTDQAGNVSESFLTVTYYP